jgi:hypothetical protein
MEAKIIQMVVPYKRMNTDIIIQRFIEIIMRLKCNAYEIYRRKLKQRYFTFTC